MLAGIAPETPLGRIVAIRSETDEKIIKSFSKDQKRIYKDWRNYKAKAMKIETFEQEMVGLEKMFERICL